MALEKIKKALTKILVTFPNWLRKQIGEDKLLHGFVGLYIQQWGKWFGPVGATIGYVVAVSVSAIRELLSETPDWNDVKWTAYICFIDLFLYIVLAMLLSVCFGIELSII